MPDVANKVATQATLQIAVRRCGKRDQGEQVREGHRVADS